MTHCSSLMVFCFASLLLSSPVLACSVCFVAKKENLMAFFATGVLLSLLPVLLVCGMGFWLYRQATAQQKSADSSDAEQQKIRSVLEKT